MMKRSKQLSADPSADALVASSSNVFEVVDLDRLLPFTFLSKLLEFGPNEFAAHELVRKV